MTRALVSIYVGLTTSLVFALLFSNDDFSAGSIVILLAPFLGVYAAAAILLRQYKSAIEEKKK